MGKLTASFPLIAGICILLVLAGIWIDRTILRTRIQRIEYQIVETPIEIPAKSETKKGVISAPTAETMKRDTVFLTAPCDSLRKWAMERLKPFRQSFIDTVDVKADTTASFWAREITRIEVDPWTQVITKTRTYQDAVLRATKVTVYDTELIASPWWTAVAFVAGFVLALLIG
jgi:hypothetical protein